MPRVYCFNPNCLQINRDNDSQFCHNCGAALSLKDRYQAIAILHKNNRSQVFRVSDRLNTNSCILRQIHKDNPYNNYFNRLVTYLKEIEPHPDIPDYIDSFETDSYCYLVRGFIEGNNLETLVNRSGTFAVDRVWQVLLNILPVLHHLHSYKLIHREIEPQNIIYSDKLNKFILVDWMSLTKVKGDRNIQSDTSLDIYSGSAEFSAPESLEGTVCFASDLYSLGLVCVYLLTGLRPFDVFNTIDRSWVWRDNWQISKAEVNSDRRERLGELIDKLIVPDLDRRLRSPSDVLRMMGCSVTDWESAIARKKRHQDALEYTWTCQKFLRADEELFAGLNCIDYSDDGKFIASGGEDKKISISEVETGDRIVNLYGHQGQIADIKFVPNTNILISGDRKGKIYFWRWNGGRNADSDIVHELDTGSGVAVIALHPGLPMLASAHIDKKIRIWDRQTKELITTLAAHSLAVTDVQFAIGSPLLASASQDRIVKIWQTDNWELKHSLKGHNWAIKSVAFNADASILASAGDGKDIKIWDLKTHQLLRNLSGHSWSVSCIAFLPNSKTLLLSASWDKKIKLWDIETGEELAVLEGHQDSIFDLAVRAIAPDRGFSLATTSKDKTIGIWEIGRRLSL
ncbi:WD40 repeat domain-containing serine/threonine-protein kinase [Pseudanabaena sp. PCC 6802]|uniref:WD40 repeat domain-containing serine/threonine-protein kinase n=1 Tax=Pseudanabaena sp. PCC 6802 TaxID=118173 RepID=UPI0003710D0B|nr:WD40 repeat domain-containing serine/threonine-protein kinase [Pseudanabaena sp. PCC 6802]